MVPFYLALVLLNYTGFAAYHNYSGEKHMILKILTIVTLLVSFNSAFAGANFEKLTEVEREPCLLFAMITPVDQMKEDVHYENTSHCDQEDSHGNCLRWSEYVKMNYGYVVVTITDIYNDSGKLITSKVSKTKTDVFAIGDTPAEGVERLMKEIEKVIFNSTNPTCKDSYYK